MAFKRNASRTLSDSFMKTRSKAAKPSRVSLIKGGVKYKSGCAPAQVCPPAGRRIPLTIATPV